MPLRVCRIHSEAELAPYQDSLSRLLKTHRAILLDDAQRSGNGTQDTALLFANTASAIPCLWLLVDNENRVWAAGALTDVQPNRHAFLHGVSDPGLAIKTGITQTFLTLAKTAFEELHLQKIKAEFEANNRGAKGFCLRLGFNREAVFRQDIEVNGQCCDVLVYALSRQKFQADLPITGQPVCLSSRSQPDTDHPTHHETDHQQERS